MIQQVLLVVEGKLVEQVALLAKGRTSGLTCKRWLNIWHSLVVTKNHNVLTTNYCNIPQVFLTSLSALGKNFQFNSICQHFSSPHFFQQK